MDSTRQSPGELFLTNAGISKEDCFRLARSLGEGPDPLIPTPLQGGNSYTLHSGDIVVQFRAQPLDLEVLTKAREIHGTKYVFPMECVQSKPFYVYITRYGRLSCIAPDFRRSIPAQKTAVVDLALFLARSCEHPQVTMDVEFETIKRFLESCCVRWKRLIKAGFEAEIW